jgi:soluble lytic murein transglycosylase-like protein
MSCTDPMIIAKIYQYAAQYGINPAIALAQINQESGCRPTVCSNMGACGIAQFLRSTFAQYGSGNINNIDDSLNAWGNYMRHLLDLFGGDYRLALAGYHSGEGAARASLANPAGNPLTNNYVNSILGSSGNYSSQPPGNDSGLPDFSGWFDASNSNGLSPLVIVGGIVLLYLILR